VGDDLPTVYGYLGAATATVGVFYAAAVPDSVHVTITPAPLTATGVAAGSIDAAALAPGAVGSAALAAGAVGSGALAAGAVGSAALATGAVGSGALAAGAVGSSALAAGAVGSAALAVGAVGAMALATHAVGAGAIAPSAVGPIQAIPISIGGPIAALFALTRNVFSSGTGGPDIVTILDVALYDMVLSDVIFDVSPDTRDGTVLLQSKSDRALSDVIDVSKGSRLRSEVITNATVYTNDTIQLVRSSSYLAGVLTLYFMRKIS